jgi:UDPglucose--hexose-1-phosphate uridylyltransferase
MSTMRLDPTTREWVIIATDRGRRPDDFVLQRDKRAASRLEKPCPFCPGNEDMTPPEVLSHRDHATQNWRVRAFPNRFPAVAPGGSTQRKQESGLLVSLDGVGIHEVIVETPSHDRMPGLMSVEEVQDVLLAYQERFRALIRKPWFQSIIIFKNHGLGAGTSLEHPHSQLVATAVVPRHLRMRQQVALDYYDATGRCVYSDLALLEADMGIRLVASSDRFVAFHPFASSRPFETWILPRARQPSFSEASPDDLSDLAGILRTILIKLHRGLNNPDFNYVLDLGLPAGGNADHYMWHFRLFPRLSETAGFEMGSGIYINTALPEETAEFMRGVRAD